MLSEVKWPEFDSQPQCLPPCDLRGEAATQRATSTKTLCGHSPKGSLHSCALCASFSQYEFDYLRVAPLIPSKESLLYKNAHSRSFTNVCKIKDQISGSVVITMYF